MSAKHVVFFVENNEAPVLLWFDTLPEKVQDKAYTLIRLLEEFGEQLHRPKADYLRDGIYELRWSEQGVQYRILYGFHGREVVILLHGVTKKKKTPGIDLARERLDRFKANPTAHTYEE